MLKALELIGFKSFADKTRFEFDRGISAIVGPNGSGKSNVVDAIRWVLGEQSAKSLRGREMADVIFNGSGTRRSAGMAEVTLIFDNRAGLLPVQTEEVAITRRVYRGGEGEYLINRQPSRLRDIRELFLGTGAATEAYSVIEQGKVDVLLQASNKDRRIIFEEAAGISRFKIKKLEALRKLEHADQNLLRVKDVLEEVDRQLRSVRQQSARARRYQEYSARLRELRVGLAMEDYQQLQRELQQAETHGRELQSHVHDLTGRRQAWEEGSARLEAELDQLEQQRLDAETKLADVGQRIAALQATIDHERPRTREWQAELARHRQQWLELIRSAGELDRRQSEAAEQLGRLEQDQERHEAEADASETRLTELAETVTQRQQQLEQHRDRLMDLMRRSATLSNERAGYEAQQKSLEQGHARLAQRLQQLSQQQEQLEGELAALEQSCRQSAADLEDYRGKLEACRARKAELLERRDRAVQSLGELRQQHAGAVERAAVLRDLQDCQEGLGQGVKQALARRASADPGPWAGLRGLVAELLEVEVEHARLIEVALGPRSACLVLVGGPDAQGQLAQISKELEGRAGIIVLDPAAGAESIVSQENPPPNLGVLSTLGSGLSTFSALDSQLSTFPAARLVRTPPGLEPLAAQLLGTTWIVPDLATALRLRREGGATCRYVTAGGDLVDADGALELGPASAGSGLISRHSELRALGQQLDQLAAAIAQAQADLDQLQSALAECETTQHQLQQHVEEAAELVARRQAEGERARQQFDQLRREREVTATETTQIAEELDRVASACRQVVNALNELQDEVTRQNAGLIEAEMHLAQAEEHRQQAHRQATAARVEWAKVNERLQALRHEAQQLTQQQAQRGQALESLRQDAAACRQRIAQSCREILDAQSQLALLYLGKEDLGWLTHKLNQRHEQERSRRNELAGSLAQLRQEIHEAESQQHAQELQVGDIRHRLRSLCERMREDYGLELAELVTDQGAGVGDQGVVCKSAGQRVSESASQQGGESARQPVEGSAVRASADSEIMPAMGESELAPSHAGLAARSALSRPEIEEEIEELRRKIAALGAVNLDSLRELEELETRSGVLTHQRDDLLKAKQHHEDILRKINAESRKLFADTLDSVRGHFQDLFRKLFGGGRADIILEDELDILESGIEIIARPPGKEPRSISQLSGGEKTLTAVALLLAIFRSRPSPFCVLDEVDAALDEGNIDRFIAVLNEFLSWTQFILITHSKRTMICAGVLYGVTMQESGVSKRVAVRFEDVSEDGQFRVPPEGEPAEGGGDAASAEEAA